MDGLRIGDAVHIKDVTLPPNVTAVGDPEQVVATVTPPAKEEEKVEVTGEEAAEPELIKKGKKEEEEAEGAEGEAAAAPAPKEKEEKK